MDREETQTPETFSEKEEKEFYHDLLMEQQEQQ